MTGSVGMDRYDDLCRVSARFKCFYFGSNESFPLQERFPEGGRRKECPPNNKGYGSDH